MVYTIKLLPTALNDLRQARIWYNEQSENLGDEFKREITSELSFISKNPDAYQIKFEILHQSLVHRFPYAIYYFKNDEKQLVIIFGIIHTRRNPEIVIKRASK